MATSLISFAPPKPDPFVVSGSPYSLLSQQIQNSWKQNNINPFIQGVNRADELAQMLADYGVKDINDLRLQTSQVDDDTVAKIGYGDTYFGQLAGIGSGGEKAYLTRPSRDSLDILGNNAYKLADSYAGKGYVSYVAQFSPDGQLVGFVPQWGSSSDAADIRQDLLGAAAFLAPALLGGTAAAGGLAGAGSSGAGLSAADAAYALGMGETAAGGGLLSGAAGTAGMEAALADAAAAAASGTTPEAIAAWGSSAGVGTGELAALGGGATSASAFTPSMNYGPGMTGAQTSVYDAVVGATGSPGLANTAANVTGPLSSAAEWMKANPTAGRLLMSGVSGLLSASGGSSGGSGGYKDSGYRPTITRGGWQPSVTPRSMALTPTSINLPTTGQPNSGLWRYGLLGG